MGTQEAIVLLGGPAFLSDQGRSARGGCDKKHCSARGVKSGGVSKFRAGNGRNKGGGREKTKTGQRAGMTVRQGSSPVQA